MTDDCAIVSLGLDGSFVGGMAGFWPYASIDPLCKFHEYAAAA
jgi:hypothetical protein